MCLHVVCCVCTRVRVVWVGVVCVYTCMCVHVYVLGSVVYVMWVSYVWVCVVCMCVVCACSVHVACV